MCIFCDIIEGKIPSSKVYEDDSVLAILDISQVTLGHTILLPKQHMTNIYDADPQVLAHLIQVAQSLAKTLTEKLGAQGCNLLMNNNPIAGQAVDHLHLHIIPRYSDQDGFVCTMTPSENVDLAVVLQKIQG